MPDELAPGVYRVSGYYALLDSQLEIIDNDGVYDDGLTLMVVPEAGAGVAFVELTGEAILASDFGAMPVLDLGVSEGTYIVGIDIFPGRYRVSDPDFAYASRLAVLPGGGFDIIGNEGGAGNVIIDVTEGDFAFQFSGVLELL